MFSALSSNHGTLGICSMRLLVNNLVKRLRSPHLAEVRLQLERSLQRLGHVPTNIQEQTSRLMLWISITISHALLADDRYHTIMADLCMLVNRDPKKFKLGICTFVVSFRPSEAFRKNVAWTFRTGEHRWLSPRNFAPLGSTNCWELLVTIQIGGASGNECSEYDTLRKSE